MPYTEKTCLMNCLGRTLRFCNQKSRDWTHPYEYEHNGGTLSSAGCGIFALTHAVEWMHGLRLDPDEVAEVSVAVGGRGDDGTDRPMLLKAMQEAGRLTAIGLRYDFDGLCNDHDALWQTMEEGGCALTNLRVGHIVAVVDHRLKDGERQLLIIDSSRDSVHPSVRGDIREVVPGSEIYAQYINRNGVRTGGGEHYAMYWVPITRTSDFNLLHKI